MGDDEDLSDEGEEDVSDESMSPLDTQTIQSEEDGDWQRYLPLGLVVGCLLVLIVIFVVVNVVFANDSSEDSDDANKDLKNYKKGGGSSMDGTTTPTPTQIAAAMPARMPHAILATTSHPATTSSSRKTPSSPNSTPSQMAPSPSSTLGKTPSPTPNSAKSTTPSMGTTNPKATPTTTTTTTNTTTPTTTNTTTATTITTTTTTATTTTTTTATTTTTTTTTTSTTTTTTTTTTSTMTTTPTPSSTPKRENPKRPLTCVYGAKLTSAQRFPEDGLCDFALYESLYKDYKNSLTDELLPNFQRFRREARRSSRTQFGVAIDFEYATIFVTHIHRGDVHKATLHSLWADRIFHYGVIDVYPNIPYVNDQRDLEGAIRRLWPTFEMAAAQLKSVISPQQPSYSFLGIAMTSTSWMKEIQRLATRVYKINFLIFRGDYFPFHENVPQSCITMGPTHMKEFSGLRYSLGSAHNDAELIQGSPVNTTPSVSITAAGLYFSTTVSGMVGKAGEACVPLPLANRTRGMPEFCKNPEYKDKYDSTYNVAFYSKFNKQPTFAFSYDNKQSLRYKLCSLKANYTTVHYGIAVFDLDVDDWDNTCGFGNYSRLRFVKDLLNYFRFSFFSPGDVSGCLKL